MPLYALFGPDCTDAQRAEILFTPFGLQVAYQVNKQVRRWSADQQPDARFWRLTTRLKWNAGYHHAYSIPCFFTIARS